MIVRATVGLAVLILSSTLCRLWRSWAAVHNLLDRPNARSLHVIPTPRAGGIAIVSSVAIGVFALVVSGQLALSRGGTVAACAILLVALVGAIDDARSLPSVLRLIVHVALAAIVIATARPWQEAGPLAWTGAPLVAVVVGVVWMVGLTNAYNFMDGIDGLAGGQAIVAGFAWAAIGRDGADAWVSACGLMLAAASAGFLLHNWSPARLFMGDVGSTSIGFALGAFPLVAGRRGDLAAAIVLMWPFVFDTSFTFLHRLVRGENVFEAHRSHLYQRLIAAGWSHGRVSLTYYALALIAAAGTLMQADRALSSREREVALVAVVSSIAVAMTMLVWMAERSAEKPRNRHHGVDASETTAASWTRR